jgi:hypothetical protein
MGNARNARRRNMVEQEMMLRRRSLEPRQDVELDPSIMASTIAQSPTFTSQYMQMLDTMLIINKAESELIVDIKDLQ